MFSKTVLITGCSSGIGYHLAKRLQQQNFDVIASCRSQKAKINLENQGFKSVLLDVSHQQSIDKAIKSALTLSENQSIDVLINNAGFVQAGAIEDLTKEALYHQFETNFFGICHLVSSVLPLMRQRGFGRIINISSILGVFPVSYLGAYNASKYALEGYTRTLQLELKDEPIFASIIQPGPIATDIQRNALKKPLKFIDFQKSRHQKQYQLMVEAMRSNTNASKFTKSPEAVLKKVMHAINAKRPKVSYPVTTPAHVMFLLKRIMPERWFFALLYQVSKSNI